MSGIFGAFRRDGGPLPQHWLPTMRATMTDWASDGASSWTDGTACLGQPRLIDTPEAQLAFTATARLDNREELAAALGLSPATAASLADGDLVLRAYLAWGRACVDHLLGDWSLAAWHADERRLFLARDQHGLTSLYYVATPQVFAFASSRKALLALEAAPSEIDELYLAQLLVRWDAHQGEATAHRHIRRLPPAHMLDVDGTALRTSRYWAPENLPELRLRHVDDYVETLTELFTAAVSSRLRSARPVATTLSGGLNSGAVATFAARELAARGERLRAFTATPLLAAHAFTDPERIRDELPRAQAVAAHAGDIDLQALRTGINPLEGIRRMLAITDEPKDAASNAFWLVDLLAAVADAGIGTLLVGRGGNWTISWDGGTSSPLPAPGELPWRDASAINPAFARRLNLTERMRADTGLTGPVDPPSPRDRRLAMLLPGRWNGGCTLVELGAAHGLSLRDPTLDSRVIAFCLRVPDRFFTDPATGEDRQLARRLTKGLLPNSVRLARPRGHQAADLVPRLRASRAEIDACLRRLGAGPAAAYLDLRLMRLVWQEALTVDGPRTSGRATSVLMRGIGVGLFIDQTLAGSDRPFPESAQKANQSSSNERES